ncbi:MAG: ribosomal protein S19-domain-containing protein, partial [Olpidium bornovanus]
MRSSSLLSLRGQRAGGGVAALLDWKRAGPLVAARHAHQVAQLHRAHDVFLQADNELNDAEMEMKKKRTFRKFTYRGVELEQLLDMDSEALTQLVHCRARRRFQRGLKRKPMGLIKKLRKAKKEAGPNEKPATVKTHLRDMIIVPEMIGSVVGVYNGKTFNQVEIKPEMIGHYLGEFSIS